MMGNIISDVKLPMGRAVPKEPMTFTKASRLLDCVSQPASSCSHCWVYTDETGVHLGRAEIVPRLEKQMSRAQSAKNKKIRARRKRIARATRLREKWRVAVIVTVVMVSGLVGINVRFYRRLLERCTNEIVRSRLKLLQLVCRTSSPVGATHTANPALLLLSLKRQLPQA